VRIWLVALVAACGHPAATPVPHNASTTGPSVHVDRDEPLGWLALGTLPTSDGSWIPVSDQVGALTLTDDPLPQRVTVIGSRGAPEQLTVGASIPLKYGCDNNELGVRPLGGVRLPPGPAWMLPPTAPSDWHPAAIAVHSTHADPNHHAWVAGWLAFELWRHDSTHADLVITRDGRKVYEQTSERAEMDGADHTGPLDLAESVPGIPEPIAAWSFSPAGPFLVVMLVPGYEGVTLKAFVIDEATTRVVEGMELYLYACAF
jgi:hypothetical protein